MMIAFHTTKRQCNKTAVQQNGVCVFPLLFSPALELVADLFQLAQQRNDTPSPSSAPASLASSSSSGSLWASLLLLYLLLLPLLLRVLLLPLLLQAPDPVQQRAADLHHLLTKRRLDTLTRLTAPSAHRNLQSNPSATPSSM
jgi:hypothetical protein